MSERDDDFGFDFFEEPETSEAPPGDRPPRRGAPRQPSRRSDGGGIAPLLRLGGLIAFAILIIVLLVLWVQSCQGSSKRDSYRKYMDKVAKVASDSTAVGKQAEELLTTPGIKNDELVSKLNGLAQQQQTDATLMQEIIAPTSLRTLQLNAAETMQLRLSGLRGLADAFQQTAGLNDSTQAGTLLAAQVQRLTASDVLWDDLFKGPAVQELQREGIGGVPVPDSSFLKNHDLASAAAMTAVFRRIHGAATGGGAGATTGGATTSTVTGAHGSALVPVTALPTGTVLAPGVETTVKAGVSLAFAVAVKDSGDFQEVKIPVTLTIQQAPSPIVRKQVIDIINPGEVKTITFSNLGQIQYATKTSVRVDIDPVPGEKNTGNNTAEYPVIFSLG